MERAELEIGGMTCEACVRTVERRLKSLPGVDEAHVDLKSQSAQVGYEGGKTDAEQMVAAVEKLGYTARLK